MPILAQLFKSADSVGLGKAWASAFLTSSQVMHLQKQRFKVCTRITWEDLTQCRLLIPISEIVIQSLRWGVGVATLNTHFEK